MARKTQQGRRAAKKQSRVQGKEVEECPSRHHVSAEATAFATVVPEPAKLAQESEPALPAIAEQTGEHSGSDPVAPPTPPQPKEPAIASDASLAVGVPAQQAEDSTSAAPLTQADLAELSVDVATLSEPQKPDVAHEDFAQAAAAAHQPQELSSAARQPYITIMEAVEQQAEDSVLTPILPPAQLASSLTNVVIASGPQRSDAVPAATTVLEDPMHEIEEPSLAALEDDSAAMVVDEPVVAKSEVIMAASSRSDEQAVVAVTATAAAVEEYVQLEQDKVGTASDTALADVPEAVETAQVVKAAVAEDVVEPPTIEKISKLEVRTDLHPRMAGTPSPCRERASPRCEASRATHVKNPRDCWVITTGAIWKLFFGQKQRQQQEQQAR